LKLKPFTMYIICQEICSLIKGNQPRSSYYWLLKHKKHAHLKISDNCVLCFVYSNHFVTTLRQITNFGYKPSLYDWRLQIHSTVRDSLNIRNSLRAGFSISIPLTAVNKDNWPIIMFPHECGIKWIEVTWTRTAKLLHDLWRNVLLPEFSWKHNKVGLCLSRLATQIWSQLSWDFLSYK